MTLSDLLRLLDVTPAIVDIHPVSLCFLPSDVTVFESAAEVAHLLDNPEFVLPGRYLIKKPAKQYTGRFPQVTCKHNPFTPELNKVLFERYDEVAEHMLCQNQLADHIVKEAASCKLVILFLVDGLSYEDIKEWEIPGSNVKEQNEPCLVNVPSVTRVAFPNIIGSPTIAERLFSLGYHNRLGFTYWTRQDNELTDRLFYAIPDVQKTNLFPQILNTLHHQFDQNLSLEKIYVQIIRTGLDGYAHSQKRRPPIKAIVDEIKQEFMQITNLCAKLNQKYGWRINVHLTSDHGILWFHEFEPDVVGAAPSKASARWCNWRDLYYQGDKGRQFLIQDEEYYCLGYPKLRRPPRIDEQGVHGGISYQESIVPFLTVRIR
jgi:hypothetical protein